MALCYFAAKKKIRCECGFGTASVINTPSTGVLDKQKHAQSLMRVKKLSKLTAPQFRKSYNHISRKVDLMLAKGKHDDIFNGKWYIRFLADDIQRIANGAPYTANGIHNRLASIILSTVDFSSSWADRLRAKVKVVGAKTIKTTT